MAELKVSEELIVEKLDDGNVVFSLLEGYDEVVLNGGQVGKLLEWLSSNPDDPNAPEKTDSSGIVNLGDGGFFKHLENG